MITFIGNNANKQNVTDGGRLKMRLFIDLLKKEGNEVDVIELDGWKKHLFRIINNIKKSIKRHDTIVIMAGPKGCRFIIPIVCHFNKAKKARVVFCPVGIGTVDRLIKSLSQKEIDNFINCVDFHGIKDERMKRYLSSLEFVCPENDIQDRLYKTFYGLDNTVVIENFRDIVISKKEYRKESKPIKLIYASRVKEYKGILDLINVVNQINKEHSGILSLDIFGDNQLEEQNVSLFESMLSKHIQYHGVVSSSDINKIIKEYDLFCLPTKYYGEGTSGALVESMIAGTPALVSSYSQVDSLIHDGQNGFVFKIGDNEDMKQKLLNIVNNFSLLEQMGLAAQESAKKYTYSYNRETFTKIMIGDKK